MPDEKSTLLDVSTKAPAPDSVRDQEVAVHHIRIVGGGAAGLELVTRLGDTLGRHGRARITLIEKGRTHLWKPLLHAIAAGSMDPGGHELNYLAQAHWHHFRYRFGEMIGLDRTKKEVWIAATHDEEGRQITPPRAFRYDTLVIAVGRPLETPVTLDPPSTVSSLHAGARDTTHGANDRICHQGRTAKLRRKAGFPDHGGNFPDRPI
jgi:pyridine nucleotide-disulfide oxidoreductase